MSELDDKLNSILGNPQMMQQIMSLAQSMNKPDAPVPPPPKQESPLDPAMLTKLAGLMQRGTIDNNQKLLLQALNPYLSGTKLQKLERAMRAAKMAGIASDVVGAWGLNPGAGR